MNGPRVIPTTHHIAPPVAEDDRPLQVLLARGIVGSHDGVVAPGGQGGTRKGTHQGVARTGGCRRGRSPVGTDGAPARPCPLLYPSATLLTLIPLTYRCMVVFVVVFSSLQVTMPKETGMVWADEPATVSDEGRDEQLMVTVVYGMLHDPDVNPHRGTPRGHDCEPTLLSFPGSVALERIINKLSDQYERLYRKLTQRSERHLLKWVERHPDVFGVLHQGPAIRLFDAEQPLATILVNDSLHLQTRHALLDQLNAFVLAYMQRAVESIP